MRETRNKKLTIISMKQNVKRTLKHGVSYCLSHIYHFSCFSLLVSRFSFLILYLFFSYRVLSFCNSFLRFLPTHSPYLVSCFQCLVYYSFHGLPLIFLYSGFLVIHFLFYIFVFCFSFQAYSFQLVDFSPFRVSFIYCLLILDLHVLCSVFCLFFLSQFMFLDFLFSLILDHFQLVISRYLLCLFSRFSVLTTCFSCPFPSSHILFSVSRHIYS